MKRVFFVDYENVDTKGLDGLSRLSSNDIVFIYYSEKHSRMSFGLHRRICESSATFFYRKIKDFSKNALDYELIGEAEDVVTETRVNYYIISNDKGYQDFIDRKSYEGYNVELCSNIVETNENKLEDLKKVIKKRLVYDKRKPYRLTEERVTRIAKLIMNSKDKQELNRGLQQIFYNEDVKYVFSRLKDITYDM